MQNTATAPLSSPRLLSPPLVTETDGTRRLYAAAAALTLLVAALLWAGPALLRPDVFDGDAAHHVWWLYRYADPTLFPGDVMFDYFRTSAPLGYRAFYASIAPHVDVLFATELVSIALYLMSGWLAWRIGTALDVPRPALLGLFCVAAFVVVLYVAIRSAGGLLPPLAFQRTFAMPLVLLALWALVAQRYAWVGAAWLGAALFYPVVLPVLGLTAACVFLRELVVERRMPDAWWSNAVLGVAAVVLALFGMPKAEWLGPAYTFAEAVAMPEYGVGGRLQLYEPGGFVADVLRNQIMGVSWGPKALAVFVAAALGATLGARAVERYARRALDVPSALRILGGSASGASGSPLPSARALLPFPVWALLGTGVALWALLRFFPEQTMFDLYMPNRHSRWAIAAFGIVALAGAAYVGVVALTAALYRPAPALARAVPRLAALAAPAVALVVLVPHARAVNAAPVDRDLENVYAFIASLPKDTLVAAHPTLADYVPLRTRRSVLTSTETSMPWLKEYYAIVKPRVEASLAAAYATDIGTLDAELAPYGVDVFVTAPAVFEDERYMHYHEPYQSELVGDLVATGRAHGFALRDPPADRVLFRSGDYYVLDVRDPEARETADSSDAAARVPTAVP